MNATPAEDCIWLDPARDQELLDWLAAIPGREGFYFAVQICAEIEQSLILLREIRGADAGWLAGEIMRRQRLLPRIEHIALGKDVGVPALPVIASGARFRVKVAEMRAVITRAGAPVPLAGMLMRMVIFVDVDEAGTEGAMTAFSYN